MKALFVFLFALGLGLVSEAATTLQTLDRIDVGRYVGTWYQIARNPVIFESGCVCSRQVLTPDSSGSVAVYNSCNFLRPEGKLMEIRGTASADDASSNAKLSVSFNIPSTHTALPWKGKYWVIALDPEYRWAVVSDPSRYSLYILARTPKLSEDLYLDALKAAAAKTNISRLKRTPQDNCTYPTTMSDIE